MVMVSARLTRRWRLSYRHDLTNAAIAASRVSYDALADDESAGSQAGRSGETAVSSMQEGS
jgi:hypothetical protein